ncbi:hypothetical protein U1Q18_011932 [Sarracenia purpurea var. burkii]
MAFLTGRTSLVGLCHRRRPVPSITHQPNSNISAYYLLLCLQPSRRLNRWLNTSTESTPTDLAGKNAYDLLGVSETSSFAEIKASFRKLAKETHPDLASQAPNHSSASHRFVQILAAYEVLSILLRLSFSFFMNETKTLAARKLLAAQDFPLDWFLLTNWLLGSPVILHPCGFSK